MFDGEINSIRQTEQRDDGRDSIKTVPQFCAPLFELPRCGGAH
jgi:hypothetical protein